MARGRSLLILVVIALGLGAYLYFVEMKRDTSAPEEKKTRAFTVESGKIVEVEVHNSTGNVTTIRKANDAWSVVAPVASAADMQAVGSLVGTLETLDIQKVIDENPSSVAPYGLEPPRYSLTFKIDGDPAPHKLNIGAKTPTGADMYARIDGQPKLFTITAFTDDMLNKSPFDLRDKTVMKFEREGLDAITVEATGAPTVTLAKKGDDWRITAPIDARADVNPVEMLINRAAQVQAKSVESGEAPNAPPPTPADLKKFGLDKPQLVATFGAGSTRATLALGGKKDDATIYARDMSRPVIFSVEKSLLDDLKKKADDLRLKDVFAFRSFTVSGLDITYAGTTYTLGKAKPAGTDNASATEVWKLLKPAEKDVNQTGATDLLNTLSSLRAETFADKALASGEDLVVVARYGDAKTPSEERVTLRKSGTTVHAIRAGESSAAVLPVADFDKAVAQLKELTGTK
jgi:hypothetical protein